MAGNYVIGRLSEGQMRGVFEQGPPAGDAHAVPMGEGLEALCGITVLHIDEQSPFPLQTTGSGLPGICRRCWALASQG